LSQTRSRWLLAAAALALLTVGVVLWRYTPLSEWATPSRLAQWIETFKDASWSPLAVIGIYILGGLVVCPLLLLIGATAVVFDPLVAIPLSLAGALSNATVTYFIGAKFARGTVKRAFGTALKRVSDALQSRGMLAVAAIRTVPVAPFTLVNIAAGSIGVRYVDYLIGTALGLAPGIIVLTAFGNQLHEMWRNPTSGRVAVFIAIVLGWIGLSLALQKLTSKKIKQSQRGDEARDADDRRHDRPRP
jgi:uncharacterized membrane protein YdjX (TVP38/TMEM64 family)